MPPTPDMVDAEYGNNDPEATHIRRSSGSSTPNRTIATDDVKRPVPPPLPARFQSTASSASTYSTAEDHETSPSHPAPAGFTAEDGMDASERREYEQYLESIKQNEAENARLQHSQPTSGSVSAAVTGTQPPMYADATGTNDGSYEQDIKRRMDNVQINPVDGRVLEGSDEPVRGGLEPQGPNLREKQDDLR